MLTVSSTSRSPVGFDGGYVQLAGKAHRLRVGEVAVIVADPADVIRSIAPGTCAMGSAAEAPGGRRWLPQTMNRCRYRLTAVSVSVLTLPS